MKTLLLCGAALCTMTAAYPALAADDSAIQLNLGGYFKGYVSYVNQDEAAGQGVRAVDILRQTEVHFDGKTTLDNGLTVGAHIEGQADGGDDFFLDESYIFGSGSWGKANFGRTYGAPYVLQVVAPSADSNIDGRLQLIQPINFTVAGLSNVGETDYDQDVSAKVDKITYISPIFSGFQGGVSFTPTVDNTSRALSGNSSNDPALSDVYEAAIRYENKVSETLSYRAGAGYTQAQSEGTTDGNRQAWNLGLDFDIGAFGIGTAYQVDDLGDANNDAKMLVIGADYTVDDVIYGTSYYNKKDDVNNIDFDRYSVGATYKVIPGLSFRGSVGYYDINQGATNVNATAVLLGTDIKF
jgi:outer membrane protein OmpU